MSYELANLKREVDNLKFSKADGWLVRDIENTVRHLAEALMKATNIISGLEERIYKLEQKDENWKMDGVQSLLTKITGQICELRNQKADLEERIYKLEQKDLTTTP